MTLPAQTKPTLWIIRSPMPSLVQSYCKLHPELNLPIHKEIQTCSQLLARDAPSGSTLVHTNTDLRAVRSYPIAALARERGWDVRLLVLLANPETIAKGLHIDIPAAQRVLSEFRRPFPLPVVSCQIEGLAGGYWCPETDMTTRVHGVIQRLKECEEKYPHLGGVFDDLAKELQACLES